MSSNPVGVGQVEQLDDTALLDLAERCLTALGGRVLDSVVGDGMLAESVERLHRVETIAGAEKLRRIAEVDIRGAWRAEGARSTADLLARRLRLTRGEARAQAETALGLEGLPETAAALRSGDIGLGQAQVAARAAKDVRPDVREELDQLVAQDGGGWTAGSSASMWTLGPRRMTLMRSRIGSGGHGRSGGCRSAPTARTARWRAGSSSTRSAGPRS